MADEKILKDELLNDAELDNISGGTRLETYRDGNELYKRGLISAKDVLESAPVRDMLHKMGYTGYKATTEWTEWSMATFTPTKAATIFLVKTSGRILTPKTARKLFGKNLWRQMIKSLAQIGGAFLNA